MTHDALTDAVRAAILGVRARAPRVGYGPRWQCSFCRLWTPLAKGTCDGCGAWRKA